MKKRSLVISLTTLIFILASILMLGFTYGWYSDIIDLNSGTISVGDLRYSETGAFITDNTIVYPGMELMDTSITVTDSSPIDSQLRVKIEYTKVTNPSGSLVIETVDYTGSIDDHLSVTIDNAFVYNTDAWYYNDTTGVITAGQGIINIISSIYYDGNLVGNDYAGQNIGVTVTIEVKQSDNVTWSQLVSYDFSTGYPV